MSWRKIKVITNVFANLIHSCSHLRWTARPFDALHMADSSLRRTLNLIWIILTYVR